MISFNKKYGIYFAVLLVTQLLMEFLIDNEAFKSNFGSMILVMLIYSFLRMLFKFDKMVLLIAVGVVAIALEVLKSTDLVQNSDLLKSVIGSNFNLNNIWSYLAGLAVIYVMEFTNDDDRPKKKKFFGF